MSRSSDLNLLIGILALQLDFIDRDQLVTAMNTWVLDKAKPLDEILVAQRALLQDARAVLLAVVEKHVQVHNNDPQESLAVVGSPASTLHGMAQIDDTDLRSSLSLLSNTAPEVDPWGTVAPTQQASDSVRFRVLRLHAKGGLGQVSLAHDGELNRTVALKEIKPQAADRLDYRERFLREAEITGGLEHPGIVPVYGLGTYVDGRPYYAMRFIGGDSLQEATQQFHERAQAVGTTDGERSLQFRKLLGRFVGVCEAIQYAHSRGVLHRDLKPDNIMLGKYGETLVVDWGLAKVIGRTGRQGDFDEPALQPRVGDGTGQTIEGTQLGTPEYMSPEQAAGLLDELSPATDVYCLGATLYCVLTGTAPYSGETHEVLRQVQRGSFVHPRDLQPQLPRALEAICLKAMAKHQQDRYGSPQDLASDIESWLGDEPVAAHRETVSERLVRVARKHHARVQAGAAALLLVALVSIVAALVTNHSRHLEKKAKQDAILAKDDALRAKNRAEQAERQRVLDAARHAADRGDWGTALRLYDETISLASNAAAAPLRVERLVGYFAVDLRDELREELKRLDGHDLADARATFDLRYGDLLMTLGEDRGKKLVESALANADQLSPADHAYALGLLSESPKDSIEHFRGALRQEPFHHRAHVSLTTSLVLFGYRQEAKKQITLMSAIFVEDPFPNVMRAFLDLLDGKNEQALAGIEQLRSRIGEHRANLLTELFETLAASMQAVQRLHAMSGISLSVVWEAPGLMLRLVRLRELSQESLGGLGIPAVARAEEMFKLVVSGYWDFGSGRSEAAVRKMDDGRQKYPDAIFIYLAALFRAPLVRQAELAGDREKVLTEAVTISQLAHEALDAPTLVPAIHYHCAMYALTVDSLRLNQKTPLLADNESVESVRRNMQPLVLKIVQLGRAYPTDRADIIPKLISNVEVDAARQILTDWIYDNPDSVVAVRLRAAHEQRAGNFVAALKDARRGLELDAEDTELRSIAAAAEKSLAEFVVEQTAP